MKRVFCCGRVISFLSFSPCFFSDKNCSRIRLQSVTSNKIHSNSDEALITFGVQLLIKAPFWGHLFSGIIKQWNKSIERMQLEVSLDGRITLWINPTYWESTLQSQTTSATFTLRFVAVQHQLLHLIFKHPLHCCAYSNPMLFHIAADLVVQSFLPKTDHWIDWEAISKSASPTPSTLEEYYQQLIVCSISNALPKTFTADFLAEHQLWSNERPKSVIDEQIMHNSINRLLLHSFNQLNQTEKNKIPTLVSKQILDNQQQAKPALPWQKILHAFSQSSRRTRLKTSHRRPSKRYGTSPGLQVQRKQKLLIAIDTSGSITTNALYRIFNEIHRIWRGGAEIQVLECDDQIQTQTIYKGKTPTVITGKGNTLFDPPIHYANTHPDWDALIYFTDGDGPLPSIDCRCPLLWVIVPNGIEEGTQKWEQLKGRKLKMN